MEFIISKSFSFRDIDVPFWRLVEHGKTQSVTAIAFAVHGVLLKKANGNCWRLPRSSKFLKAKTQLANTFYYKNATQFDKDLAKKIRTGLVKEWRQPIPFQHATKLVNLETLLLILKFSAVEKVIVQAFQLFVADTFRQLTEQKDTEEQQKNENLLATIKKEKGFNPVDIHGSILAEAKAVQRKLLGS